MAFTNASLRRWCVALSNEEPLSPITPLRPLCVALTEEPLSPITPLRAPLLADDGLFRTVAARRAVRKSTFRASGGRGRFEAG